MLRKFLPGLLVLLGLLAAFAGPVSANDIKMAEIEKLSCKDYALRVTGAADAGYVVVYQFTLTPDFGSPTTVSGTIPVVWFFDVTVTGSFSLAGGGSVSGIGTASLLDENGDVVNTVPVTFPDKPLDCDGSPKPMIKLRKFTNGHDGDNVNGVPTPGQGDFTATNTVALVEAGSPIVWTYRVTNIGNEALVLVQVTDDRIGPIACPRPSLAVGESMDCTANAIAEALVQDPPRVIDGCGDHRPTYDNTGTVTAVGEASGAPVEDDNASHYCNPVPGGCDIALTKTCAIAEPTGGDWATCKGKLQAFTLIWPTTRGTINISGIANDAPGGVVHPGQKVTFTGPFAVNDQYLDISGDVTGRSTFHVSCSDKDMDGLTATNLSQQQLPGRAQDCGKFEGNGKISTASFINDWLLDGLKDADGKVLDCSPTASTSSSCSFEAAEPPQCGTGGTYKPATLTFQYTGGGCQTQSNSQAAGKTICSGSIDPALPVNVSFPGGTVDNVPPGGTFTIPRTQTQSVITLSNAGGTESDSIHTSCSQPLIVGDVFFSLTLVAEDGQGPGRTVTYSYGVTNTGATTVVDIAVVDDKLGAIGSIASLAPGATQTLTATALIGQTTTNVATATAVSSSCPDPGAQATATVTVLPPPPCTVTKSSASLSDDKIVYRVINAGGHTVTLDTLTLDFPIGRQRVKTVQVGGDVVFDSTKSSLIVTPGVTIGAADWTNGDVKKRQWNAGEGQDLKVIFTKKSKAPASEFTGTATFQQGCEIDLAP